ncbi:Alpha beta hydrolase [Seminavis robusta]|uniref:Alpha beta hydrolase n=1 Tax=Seminavis robusta TaxID=568900 RepID=A0A9N8EZK8_9STRA|nr:Alpha beta hydrolase [Seminavis robusta]|eukprot:Sro2029_g311770.1 Alpha beta hydrolase (241) ;mRNA; r:8490-9288
MVIIGGMAQSIPSWEAQIPSLSQSRDVLLYEARGQGPPPKERSPESFEDVSLPAQANMLMETLDEILDKSQQQQQQQVDLVGFSLGGRIALATCILFPERIRKVHITGVSADRSPLGHLTVASWKDHVRNGDTLRSFAWSVLLTTYSSKTIQYWTDNPDYFYPILDFVAQQNTREGLIALLEQCHAKDDDDDDEWPWRQWLKSRLFVKCYNGILQLSCPTVAMLHPWNNHGNGERTSSNF